MRIFDHNQDHKGMGHLHASETARSYAEVERQLAAYRMCQRAESNPQYV